MQDSTAKCQHLQMPSCFVLSAGICDLLNIVFEAISSSCWRSHMLTLGYFEHSALTAAFVLSRLVKFLLATGIYVGRIDRPVLAEGLALDVDSLPRVFRQNLLSAEAHRHPYMVQLGQMYLMKLRHKDNFGTKAGSIWRLLFVSALMPWLRKKRIQDDVDIDKEIESKMKSSMSQEEPERNPKRISRASFQIEP
mmetsp:Transcript_4756/g.11243  ORF Transcript_4756/g.11243 Transcript_4756/m.11243 type:complete len:194 (-) Transcript_4756:499-1080(-)